MTGTVISIVCWAAFSPEMYLQHMTAFSIEALRKMTAECYPKSLWNISSLSLEEVRTPSVQTQLTGG